MRIYLVGKNGNEKLRQTPRKIECDHIKDIYFFKGRIKYWHSFERDCILGLIISSQGPEGIYLTLRIHFFHAYCWENYYSRRESQNRKRWCHSEFLITNFKLVFSSAWKFYLPLWSTGSPFLQYFNISLFSSIINVIQSPVVILYSKQQSSLIQTKTIMR